MFIKKMLLPLHLKTLTFSQNPLAFSGMLFWTYKLRAVYLLKKTNVNSGNV